MFSDDIDVQNIISNYCNMGTEFHYDLKLGNVCVSLLALEQEWRPKRFLVFLNPFAGDGNGEYKFNSTVRPMFDLAGIRYTVKVTGMAIVMESMHFKNHHQIC